MAVIFTYPQKSTLVSGDLFLISDSEDENKTKNTSITSIKDAINVVDSLNALTGTVTLTGGTNITLNTSSNSIVINADGIGSGTVNKLTKWSANGSDIEDSIITEDTGGPGINIAGNVSVGSGSYISTPSILDGAGEFGSANQVLSKSSDNSFIEWATTVGGSGTANKIPMWSDSNTLTDSTAISGLTTTVGGGVELYYAGAKKFETLSTGTQFTGVLDIESDIRHTSDGDSVFGFPNNDHFRVSVNSGSDQFSVLPNQTLMKTDSTIKFIGSDSGIILYHVRESTVTTSTDRKLETDPDGIKIKGKNNANQPGALADIGGTIKFYSPDNTKYVGVQGPSANDGVNYVLQLPKSVGTTNQVLKLPTSPVSGNNQLEWGDAGGGVGTSHLIHDITAADGPVTHNSTTFKQFLTPGQEVDVNTLQCFLLDNTGLSNNTFGLFSGELNKSTAVLLAYGTLNPSPAIPASTLGYNNVPLLDSEGTQITVRLSVGTNYIIAWSTDTSNNLIGSNGSKGSVMSGPVNVLSNSKAIFTDASAMKSMTATTIASDYTLDGIDCASIVLFKDPTV